jgi:hypothetical protein
MAEVCMLIFMNMTFESGRPDGNRKASGKPKEVFSRIVSMLRWRVQNPPFRLASWSSFPGRCR